LAQGVPRRESVFARDDRLRVVQRERGRIGRARKRRQRREARERLRAAGLRRVQQCLGLFLQLFEIRALGKGRGHTASMLQPGFATGSTAVYVPFEWKRRQWAWPFARTRRRLWRASAIVDQVRLTLVPSLDPFLLTLDKSRTTVIVDTDMSTIAAVLIGLVLSQAAPDA